MINITIGSVFDINTVTELVQHNFKFSFFGAPSRFSLDGGRIVYGNYQKYLDYIHFLNDKSIPFNLCCNTVLDEDKIQFNDEIYQVLEELHNSRNGVIISRFWLGNKIHKMFPKFKLIFSTIGVLAENWEEDYLFENYDTVVCPIYQINNFDFIKNKSNYQKIEIFLNNECINWNNKCFNHYYHTSLYNSHAIEETDYVCPFLNKKNEKIEPVNIKRYLELGVSNFKLIERTSINNNYINHINKLNSYIK